MRALYEKDPNLFATRTLEALVTLWQETIPDAEHVNDRKREAVHSFWETSGYTRESLLPHGRLIKVVSENAERRGYVRGLKDAFGDLYTRLTENVTRIRLPVEGEPEGKSQERDREPKK
jgi:hypothetical protein